MARGHLLVTGFEPFGGDTCNPTAELARALHGESIAGLRVVTQVLPCEFATAPAALDAALARWRPRMVLALGQAGGRSELSLERVAINLIDARIADNAGRQPIDQPVRAAGPAAYFSSLPIKRMVQAARRAGVPAGVSHSAGTFVCNQVFYALQHRLASARPAVPSGFMHVPLLPEQAGRRCQGDEPQPLPPSLDFALMLHGLRAALGAAVESLQESATGRMLPGPGLGAGGLASEGSLD